MSDIRQAIGMTLLDLGPNVVGFALALFIATVGSVLYFFFSRRWSGFWGRVKASVLSALLSGSIAVPLVYFLSNCISICRL